MVVLLFLIIFALEICKVQPLSHYSMRFIYIVISFFALMLAFACSRNAVSKENVDIHDTIYSKYYKEPVTGFSCFHLGLQLPASLDYYDLWVEQLKKKRYYYLRSILF